MKSLMKRLITAVAVGATVTAMAVSAQAKTQVVWWDFLGGGDGVRMKTLIQQFNQEDPDIEIQGTTLEWGVPFYTKVQTSAAVGQGPDVMTYHLSRLPLGVSTGTLRPFTADELQSVGLKADDYPKATLEAAMIDGKQYAVPFDIHALIMYYNKDMLKKAGLLGDNGLPKGLDGLDNFNKGLKALQGAGAQYGLSFASGDAAGATVWRIFYALLAQQGGTFLGDDSNKVLDGDNAQKGQKATQTMSDWVSQGLAPKGTEYPASIALFTSGKAALHFNGVWEVPTMVDLAKQNKLGFEWGAVQVPILFDKQTTWADSHAFAIPDRKGNPVQGEKLQAVLKVIAWMNKHSLFWATAGHIPAYQPVTQSAEFAAMKPNADYAALGKTATYDPRSKIAGVASPAYDAALNFIQPAVNGQLDAASAIQQLQDSVQADLQ